MNDYKNTLHDLGSILAIVAYTALLFYYFNILGLIITISTIVVGLIILKKSGYVTETVKIWTAKIKNFSNIKRVFFLIIVFTIVVGIASFYSYKVQEDQFVVAISPFDYIDESGKSGSDINTANDLREKIEENKDLGIKVIMLNNPISDTEDAKSQGKKVGAHLVIYGETKSKIGNRGEIKYYILPLAILGETLVVPSFEIKNVEENNLIFSEKAKFSIVTEERITIIESIEENVSSSIYAIGAFEKYKKSNFTSAIAFFKSVKNYENESSILFYIANCYLFNNNLNESLQYFDKATEIKPQYAEAWYNKGTALGHLGRYEEAVAAYDKAIEIKPKFAEAWYNKGTALSHLGRYEEAVAAYDKAIEIKPKFAEAWYNKGNVFGHLGRYEEAVAAYDKAIEIKPKFAEACCNKGTALGHLGRYEEAVAAYGKAIEIKPKFAEAWNNKGVALDDLGRYKEAVAAYDKAIEIKPKFAEAWNNKGVALYALGRYVEAVAAYDKATEIKPQYAEVWYNKGTALGHLRRYEEAVAAYDKAIEINQKLADAWYNKGVALKNLGRYKDAEEAFEIAHKLDSNT